MLPSAASAQPRSSRPSQPVTQQLVRAALGAAELGAAPPRRRSGAVALGTIHRRARPEHKGARTSAPAVRVQRAEHPGAAELVGIEAASRVLLAPHRYEDVDEWRGQVNRVLRQVSGADVAAFALPVPGRALWLGDAAPASAPAPLGDHPVGEWRWLPAHDAALAVRIPAGEGWAAHCLHWATRRCDRELARATQLLRTLLPAFRAGVESWHRVHEHRHTLGRVIDTLADAVALVGADGRTLHRNAAASRLLDAEPEHAQLAAAMARVARAVADGQAAARATCTTRRAGYALGAVVADRLVAREAVAMVTIRAQAPAPLCDGELGARFRLTPREIEVARLVATGLTNRELAKRLAISEATTRHHVERVMAKLSVNSRGKVGAVLRNEG